MIEKDALNRFDPIRGNDAIYRFITYLYGEGFCIICLHKKTVALNEEGNAGIYCSDCGEKLSDEC